jgi:hypothetical protein
MSHSINYYIQLPDNVSEYIDDKSIDELLDSSKELLYAHTVLTYPNLHSDSHVTIATDLLAQYGITLEKCITLAHGLLSKVL